MTANLPAGDTGLPLDKRNRSRGKLLTAREVQSIKPGRGRLEMSDGGTGLYLIVQPSGRKSWALRYRYKGRPKKLTIGPYPAFALAMAREKAAIATRVLHEGRDPGAEKLVEKRRQPDLVRNVGAAFIEKWHKPRNRTWQEVERMLELHVYPVMGDIDIRDVTRRDILDLIDRIQANGVGVGVNRILANLRRLFGWAVERDIIAASPITGIKSPAVEQARDRVLSDEELRAFLQGCGQLAHPFGEIFRLLLLTGQRRDEVTAASWSEFDLDEAIWHLPGARTKNRRSHDVPLARAATALIEALPSRGKFDLLFPSRTTLGRAASGFGRSKDRLDTLMLDWLHETAEEPRSDTPHNVTLAPWRLHDLRRTAASGMARLGIGVHVVEKLLNHVSGTFGGIVGVYQKHDFANEKRAAVDAWASFLNELANERNSNVIELAKARGR